MVAMNTAVAEPAIYDKVEDANHLGQVANMDGKTAAAKPDVFDQIEDTSLLRDYDDGPGGPRSNRAKERAFRQGFLEEARRVVRDWAHPFAEMNRPPSMTPVPLSEGIATMLERFDPTKEIEEARKLRLRVRERYAVYGAAYGPDCAGRKTYHLGYRPGHEAPAARLRGRHHALEYVVEPMRELATCEVDVFDPMLLGLWLKAVEEWAERPMRPRAPMPPPRLLEVPGAMDYLARMGQIEAPTSKGTSILGESAKMSYLAESASEPLSHMQCISEPSAMHSQSSPILGESAKMEQPVRCLQLTRADQIEVRPPDWLLRGMLERDTFALVFGDPGSGKSFLAIDWACRIATGTPWRGHAVSSSPVVYIAGEGQQGFGRRIRAWSEHNGVSLADAPLYVAPAVAIPDAGQLTELMQALESLGDPPALIVLDTLARCFGGGDENSTKDMSAFVLACDAIRRHYHCTILVVHHTGHADKNRARGAIALKAALDAEYRLAKDDKLLLTATKMKDAETPAPVAMELATVDLPGVLDDYGNPVASAAIEVLDADTGAIVSKAKTIRPRGKWQDVGFAVARRLVAASDDGCVSIDTWRDECQAAGMVRQNQHRVLDGLVKRGDIAVSDDALSVVTT